MKYIIKYYRKEKGVWKYDVKLTTDFDLLINYLKIIERCSQYKLYAVTTDWEGIKKMINRIGFLIATFFALVCITCLVNIIISIAALSQCIG